MTWFSDEFKSLLAWLANLPPSVKTAIDKLSTDAGVIVKADAAIAAKDIVSGGVINTAAYVTAAKDILAKTPADAGILITDIFFILNAEVSYLLGQNPTSAASPEAQTVS